MQVVQLGADDSPHFLLVIGVGRGWWGCAGLPVHGKCGKSVASRPVLRVHGTWMICTQVNGDVVSRARHRCIELSFFEHRCLRGVRTSHSAPSLWDLWSTNQVSSAKWSRTTWGAAVSLSLMTT